jgi:4-amino-4-deoxy-L-arabinose transferase-like glycosyltransferase
LAAWIAAALGVLAKGLIGAVLPALVLLPWLVVQRRWRELPRLLHPGALLLFAAVVVPWFAAMEQRFPGFFDYFFVEQHFRRYTTTGFNNPQPWWFYFAAVPLFMLPWTAWWPKAWRTLGAGSSRGLYLWWALAVIVFFSLPRSKLVGYVLPALLPLSLLVASGVMPGRATRWAAAGSALLCLTLAVFLAWKAHESNRDIAEALRDRLQPGDRVVFVDAPFYDVPFYARLTAPPVVLSNWDDPSIPRRDNWRKELADGRRFDSAAAARQLWPIARAEELRCGANTLWLIATREPTPLADAQVVLRGRSALLLRSPGRPAAACPTP